VKSIRVIVAKYELESTSERIIEEFDMSVLHLIRTVVVFEKAKKQAPD
jgi:hypothetical protein